ncbi:ABC transporter ATP-binding protein [Desulfomonile tiedjei]|uniref:ABC-type nitrate/sulfonate/bicarbonate transport system, ATPase component n=1 Tax=Desulfomonile tiedjei (strain ATCC 49306 / DSM 6799 / DCB-1) TaxID=706587 RepID=I4CAK7_DESTA|nr:ABC transporter ATP-binding protein [Desulfomonile tiedjei]AFM26598.1 ABC-type nitrate/sulfonate/bicarbonate transport system, ATPase component [Desulfomonile tiedjei DSM 6799]
MIRFTGVNKSFHGRSVLEDLHFCVERNEVVALLGRSGSGKSTILRIISGLTCPDSGTLMVGSSKIGYIFQEPRLIPWKTALDNVGFVLKANGCDKKKAREIAANCLEEVALKEYALFYPQQLSGGMQQRVAVARAFATDPEILLMDEPFSSLDPGLKDEMHSLMKRILSERPLTVLYVSHNPEEVIRIANKIYMLGPEGKLKEVSAKLLGDHKKAISRTIEFSSWYGGSVAPSSLSSGNHVQ